LADIYEIEQCFLGCCDRYTFLEVEPAEKARRHAMHDEDSLARSDSFGTTGRCERNLARNLIDYAMRRESRREGDVGGMRSRDLACEKARIGGYIRQAPETVPDPPSKPATGESP